MHAKVFPSLRDAIHATATKGTPPMKALASELDWSPSELSMRTTLGDDNARPFPADDAHLVRLMQITGDHSILATLADKLGYELMPKRDRIPEIVSGLRDDFLALNRKFQLVLDMPGMAPAGPRRPR